MGTGEYRPDFTQLVKLEQEALDSRLKAVRCALSHPGEKGRALEGDVARLLRSFLPHEYGITTGFVAFCVEGHVRLSPQLDIIMYDALRFAPIVSFPTCDIIPLEAAYGYVEVKAMLRLRSADASETAANDPEARRRDTQTLERCLETCKEIRRHRTRQYLRPVPGSATKLEPLEIKDSLGLRSFVFAYEMDGGHGATDVAARLARTTRNLGNPTHLHGLYVAGLGFFSTLAVDDDENDPQRHSARFSTEDALHLFKKAVLLSLRRFPRVEPGLVPNLDAYYQLAWDCQRVSPDGVTTPEADALGEDHTGPKPGFWGSWSTGPSQTVTHFETWPPSGSNGPVSGPPASEE